MEVLLLEKLCLGLKQTKARGAGCRLPGLLGRGCGQVPTLRGRLPRSQVAGAYSKTWSHREDALLALYKQLMDAPAATPKEDLKSTLRAAVFLIRRAVRDIVTPVSPHPPLRGPVSARELPGCPQEVRVAREAAWSPVPLSPSMWCH